MFSDLNSFKNLKEILDDSKFNSYYYNITKFIIYN